MLWQHTRARFLQARSELGLPPALQQQQKQQQLPQTPTSPTPLTSPLRARRGSRAGAVGSLPDLDNEGEDADIAAEDRRYSPSQSSQLPETTLRLGKDVEDDIRALKFGVRGIERIKAYLEHHAEDDWYAARVDLDTARVQRATAEGMEKVNVLMFFCCVSVFNGSLNCNIFYFIFGFFSTISSPGCRHLPSVARRQLA